MRTDTRKPPIGAPLFAAALAALAANGAAAAQQPIERRMAVDPRASIRIHNLVGSTRIIGWERDSVVVTGTVGPRGGRFDMGGGGSGAKLYVELPPDVRDPSPTQLEVRVPRGARVWVKSASADIEVVGPVRAIDLLSVGGTILVRGAGGEMAEINAETMDGEVRLERAAAWTRIKTASGPVTVRGGGDVGIETVSGSVRYHGAAFQRLRVESVTGDFWFEGGVPRGARMEVESHSGRVELALPDTIAAEFSLTNFDGRIESAYGPRTMARNFRGEPHEFVLGSAVATVIIRNFKGDIVLRRP